MNPDRLLTNVTGDATDTELERRGAWPFVTFRRLRGRHQDIIWRARHHRKGLDPTARARGHGAPPFWQTAAYNRMTGVFFAIGSLLFMAGSALSLMPSAVSALSLPVVNGVFFAGSIPFTMAAYLQQFQAANAGSLANPETRNKEIKLIGWQPDSPGWLSTLSQFVGTIAFNFNTFDAIGPPGSSEAQNLVIWLPGMIGSVLFLVSAYLAFIETAHAYWTWEPGNLAWRIVFVNLLGCVFFLIASILFWVPAAPEPDWIPSTANICLGLGALAFLLGALLMMKEARMAASKP